MHDLFHDTAERLAHDTGFCQRRRQLTGPVFAQTLVFSLLRDPQATLEDFAEYAATHLDADVTPQAFDQRFTEAAACFLQELFQAAFNYAWHPAHAALLPFVRRFNGVFLRDATLVRLPAALAALFPGRGGVHAPHGQAAALKLVFEADLGSGLLTDATILAGLDNERTAAVADKPLPAGALLLEDMGFLSAQRLQHPIDQGIYVITRVPAWTAVFDERGRRLDLVKELRKPLGSSYERDVQVFHNGKVTLRLLAVRLPEAEAAQRRERVRREAKKRGRPVSHKKLELCAWNIVVTNAPAHLVGVRQAWVVRRLRWQIELVFKGFKSEGQIDQTRSAARWRVLCAVYAKLLGQVVQQWALVAAGYQVLTHSARRMARRVRQWAEQLQAALGPVALLVRYVQRLAVVLHRYCRIKHRTKTPTTRDRLLELDPEFEQSQQVA